MNSEAKVLKSVESILRSNHHYFLRCSNAAIGTPDIIACVNGRFYGIEVKKNSSKGYTATKAQLIRLAQIRSSKGVPCLVDSENLKDFERVIKNNEQIEMFGLKNV